MPAAIALWLGGSIVAAYLGRNKSVGPWGFLLFSLVFSPVIGLLSLMVAGDVPTQPSSDAQLIAAIRALQATTLNQQRLIDTLYKELTEGRATAQPAAASAATTNTSGDRTVTAAVSVQAT
jgi:hypothetical protein